MSLQDLGKKADEAAAKGKEELGKSAAEIGGLSNTTRYALYIVTAIAAIGIMVMLFHSCGKSKEEHANIPLPYAQQPGQQQAAPVEQAPAQPQTVINNNGGSSTGDVLAGAAVGFAIGSMMSNGERYNGHNYNGPPPQGYQVDPRTHTVTRIIIVKTPATAATALAPAPAPTAPAPTVAPVAAAKVKNPGDAAAQAEQVKMAQEKQAAEAKRKADLSARKASLYKARDTSKKSGFGSFASKSKK